MRTKNYLFLLSLITIILLSLALFILSRPLQIKETIFEVNEGIPFNQIVKNLNDQKIISYPNLIKIYAIISGKAKYIKTGEYKILPKNNSFSLINKLADGDIYYRQIRIKEGATFLEVLQTFKLEVNLIDNLDNSQVNLISQLSLKRNSLEGLFSPDTYFYKKGDTYIDILKRAHNSQQKLLDKLWKERRLDLPYRAPYEALILASIIEKEGIEKKDISGVFIRRLKKNMKLQSDPTVIFALGAEFDGNIKREHLFMTHPYNTYMNKGLPPGPIGLVSKSSLKAAFDPKDGTSLYFVAKGDGTHFFSDSLKEHQDAVKRYQLNL